MQLPREDLAGGLWAGELWTEKPIMAPEQVDVGAFLAQEPLPLVWPNDPEYRTFVDNATQQQPGFLVASWLYVFMHHPAAAVVRDALRQPALGSNLYLHGPVLADLAALHPSEEVRTAAVQAAWRQPDDGVRLVMRVLRSEGMLPSGHPEDRARRGRDLLLAVAPPDRAELATELRRG